ncbi:IS110 family transposase [Fulvivirga sp.]|uniref:IS110 family transposase n=1 Tax=Fulvivirga sp. TaxID=1931237 RepID=UPI0032EE2D0C
MKVIKQVVGVDVAQDELVCTFGLLMEGLNQDLKHHRVFKNSAKGFNEMLAWVESLKSLDVPIFFVMEATGVYHQKFAYWLDSQSLKLSIVLPNKISNYARTLDIKTVTDKTASQAITQFGLERKLDAWNPPKHIFRTMKQLTRERDQIVDERTVIKNQIHAESAEAYPNPNSIKRLRKRIVLLTKQEVEIKNELHDLIKNDPEVEQDVKRMTSIPGVGNLTAAIVLAETNGFELIRNKKQLTSYAGLDVRERQSGTSIKGKPRISKKGNRHLRKAMHLPALTAIRHCQLYKNSFAKQVSKHGIKMKAVVAVQRKILEFMFVLNKNKSTFDQDYEIKKGLQHKVDSPLQSSLC